MAGAWALLALMPIGSALAGPPYVTDDPEPTDFGKWEVYGFNADTTFARHALQGEDGFDINYGAAKDLQASAVISLGYAHDPVEGTHAGISDTEIGLKYRFIHQDKHGWIPDVAFFPKLELPTGGKRFGSGKVGAQFPVWAQKDFGTWSLFGGGGYFLNPGEGNRDYGQIGIALTHAVSETLSLGGELYHNTPDQEGGRASTSLGLGGALQVAPHWSIIGSGGPILTHRATNGHYAFYLALEFHN